MTDSQPSPAGAGPGAGASADALERKRRRVLVVQRVLNPAMKLAVRLGIVPGYVLIEQLGRRSGQWRRTAVGMHVEDGTGWVVAEHGRRAGWVRNVEANPQVRVWLRGRWRPARAAVLPDDDVQARLDSFGRRSHAAAVRTFGTEPVTVRFDLTPGD